jgi:nucleotide-binding universal stress UspA family protein
MIDRVLVPIDGSEMATKALQYAVGVHPDAEITLLYVAGGPSPMMGKALQLSLESDLEEEAREMAGQVFADARAVVADSDADIKTAVAVGNPSKQIVEFAEDYDAVVLGSHSSGLASRLYTGNVAKKVSSRAPVPVTVVR